MSSSLYDAIKRMDCNGLLLQFQHFMELNAKLVIPTFSCPICGNDLRESMVRLAVPEKMSEYTEQRRPGLAKCGVCVLKIQLDSKIEHAGHPGCFVEFQLPLMTVEPKTAEMLRTLWRKLAMPFPSSPPVALTDYQFRRWIEAVSNETRKQIDA